MYEKEFQEIFDMAKGKVDDIEIILSANKSFSVRINNQEIDAFNYADSKGIGIRIVKNDKTGYAYTEKFDTESFATIIKDAIESSKVIEETKEIVMEKYPEIKTKLELFNPNLEKVDVTKKIELAKKLERVALKQDKRIFNVPYAAYSDGEGFIKISNSKGLDKEEKQNFSMAFVGALANENDEKRMGSDFIVTNNFNEIDAEHLAKESVKRALELLGGKQVKSGKYPVIFNNEMMTTILSTFSSMYSAKSVLEGQSLLKGKIGEKIANENVTIIDDALMPKQFASRRFDSEGYPSQKNILVENGILKTFLHNTETARQMNMKSTGNAYRSYKGSLIVANSNFYLKAGTASKADLLKKFPQVIEIVGLQGMHSGANPISGEFSLSAEGFLYENGKRAYSLAPFTVSGNIFDLMNNIVSIADDFKFDMSSFGSASALVRDLNISS